MRLISACSKIFLVGLLVLVTTNFRLLTAYERFLSWDSTVSIQADSSLEVEEKITVFSTGATVKRGITREFPTRYTNRGRVYTVKFAVTGVKHNDKPASYRLQKLSNGTRVLIGERNTFIHPGIHTYTISYKTDRQLGFFKNFDELYWNVIGTDVRLPVERARVTVSFPQPITRAQLSVEAYLGRFGSRGQEYQVSYTALSKNTPEAIAHVTVSTTRSLSPGEAFTVGVTWPKGIVRQPSDLDNFLHSVKDNWPLGWLVAGLAVVLWWYLRAWRRLREQRRAGTVIPLFEPPENLSAAAVSYLVDMKVSATTFASSFIDLAVCGLLEIDYKPSGWFSAENYKLSRTSKPVPDTLFSEYRALLSALLLSSEYKTIQITTGAHDRLSRGYTTLEKNLKADYSRYFHDTTFVFGGGFVISGLCLLPLMFFGFLSYYEYMFPLIIGALVLFTVVTLIFSFLLKAYTTEGRKLMDRIEGFKLFLAATETERLKVIGTPPTRTPELFEKYLPYAVALGVEEQWSEQFVPVFKNLEEHGIIYQPLWYHSAVLYRGPGGFTRSFAPQAFTQSLSSSLKTSVSSSGSIPGSSSGSGGAGRSGGGGGGGGAGGW